MLRTATQIRGIQRLTRTGFAASSTFSGQKSPRIQSAFALPFVRYNSSETTQMIEPEVISRQQMQQELVDQTVIHKETVSDISDIDLSSLTHTLARVLCDIHDTHNIPWYALVIGTSCVVKLLVAPFQIYGAALSARMAKEERVIDSIKKSIPTGPNQGQLAGKAVKDHYALKGIKTGRMFASIFLQMPLTIYMFIEIRALSNLQYNGIVDEGMLWFTNLSAHDPLYMLPVLCSLCFLTNSKLGLLMANRYGLEANPTTVLMQKVFNVFFPLMGCLFAFLPAGSQLLILTNSLLHMSMLSLYRLPAFRSLFKLPPNIGLTFSMLHSDTKKLTAAFGKDFVDVKPPPLGAKKLVKKSFLERNAAQLTNQKNKRSKKKSKKLF